MTTPAPVGAWFSCDPPASEQSLAHRWSGKLSEALVAAQKEWNDWDGRLFRYADPELDETTGESQLAAFCSRAAQLAAATQDQLGSDFEVLFITAHGAWQWVNPPGTRQSPP